MMVTQRIVLLSLNIFCILLDISTCRAQVRKIATGIKYQLVTVADFDMTRKDIEKCCNDYFLNHSSVIIICFANILIIYYGLFFQNTIPIVLNIASAFLVAPSIFFVGLVFFASVGLNEEADSITHALARGTTAWTLKNMDSVRFSLYLESFDQPLSYRVAGVRMTYQQIYVQAAIYLISIIVAFIPKVSA